MSDPTPLRIERPDGRVAYDLTGHPDGPLVVLVPGMGDLRSTWRHLVPLLVAAGCQVATTDLRGHGDSDTSFGSYGDEETAGDVAALLEHLGRPAVVAGNSMGAGAGVVLAARRPELVRGLVLVGPFVRNPPTGRLTRALMRVVLAPRLIRLTWPAYLPKLYAGTRPADLDEHVSAVKATLARPGVAAAVSRTTRTDHTPAQEALPRVAAPCTVVMGALDPDFDDPAAEAAWIGGQLGAPVVMVPSCGHYPQAQDPGATATAVLDLLARVDAGA